MKAGCLRSAANAGGGPKASTLMEYWRAGKANHVPDHVLALAAFAYVLVYDARDAEGGPIRAARDFVQSLGELFDLGYFIA